MELLKFNELEDKIRGILQEHARLKRQNEELQELLRKKELELNEANITIRGMVEEKDSIRSKVDTLLDLLQDIDIQS